MFSKRRFGTSTKEDKSVATCNRDGVDEGEDVQASSEFLQRGKIYVARGNSENS